MGQIKLTNVTKMFGPVIAVDDITLTVRDREFVTLLGPSGCGKTTTMRMIAGLERPTSGTIVIGDRIMSDGNEFVPTHRRSLGMVFQSYAVWPHKTVHENVAFPLRQRKVGNAEREKRVAKILDLVGLGEYAERYPAQLSGGQQQRVALARAIVAEPDVILFDEPLSNLDAKLRDSMRALLNDLRSEIAITSVYVTHDQSEAMTLSDRVYIMNRGKLIQEGTPDEIYEKPNSLFVASFIGQANTLKASGYDAAQSKASLSDGTQLRVSPVSDAVKEMTVVVRPHQIEFVNAPGAENVLGGQVKSSVSLGDRYRVAVNTGVGEIVAEVVAGGIRPKTGDQVHVALPARACLLI